MGLMKTHNYLLLVGTISLLPGCAATCMVTSEPAGAKISVDDKYKGQTPISIRTKDKFGFNSVYVFKAEMDGYGPQFRAFKEPGPGTGPNEAIPAQIHFVMIPTGSLDFTETPYGLIQVVGYEFDTKARKGILAVNISGKSIEVREWIVKNIAKVCSSREIRKAGQETITGGVYNVTNESVINGVLRVEFVAGQ